jgi:molecular chaperone GrpE (heat shock protein)
MSAEAAEMEQQLPWDEDAAQQESQLVAPPNQPAVGPGINLVTPAANAQGHYQQGTAVYGQVLNEPQQTASQRAVQLLEENQRLREEMKSKLKDMENLQAKLKQQDELWARARQEFVEVRGVVDNLTRENSQLKMQVEKLESEKVELAKQYQGLMQTVEQTLDDLLLKAITEPPAANPPKSAPATAPATVPATVPATTPATVPATQPPPAPPIVTGQQASALLKSQQ